MPATKNSHLAATDPSTPACWIDSPSALTERLHAWHDQPTVALDTEFVRERTYWPRLALVQLAVPGQVVLVDVLAEGVADALRPLLQDSRILKLMHSASEDLQALKVGIGALPKGLFDTQTAAALAGLGAGMSYQKLVEQVTGVALEKGETRSDWLQRPLTASQQRYAADDVRYLHALHAELDARLRASGRLDWLLADCDRAVRQAEGDEFDPWPHLALRSAQFLDAQAQGRLCRLLRWRDAQARSADRPRSWILDNELAVALARTPPADRRAFDALLDTHPKSPRRTRGALWEAIKQAPSEEERAIPLASVQDETFKRRLRKLQDAVAEETSRLGLPEGVLASRRQLENLLVFGEWPEALGGWRREILQARLAPLLATGD